MGEILKTPIANLLIRRNKVVMDARGYLCELAPGGLKDEMLAAGVSNLVAVGATKQFVPRGSHYHLTNIDNAWFVAGSAMWFFHDFRGASSSRGVNYAVVVGYEAPPKRFSDLPHALIRDGVMAHIQIPAGVYHIMWPLTKAPAVLIETASVPYDEKDYVRMKPREVPGLMEFMQRYGLA